MKIHEYPKRNAGVDVRAKVSKEWLEGQETSQSEYHVWELHMTIQCQFSLIPS